jgi:ribonuclease HI
MTKKQSKYYVVWKGRQPGVYDSWERCSAQVHGYPSAEYKSFDSLADAKRAYSDSYQAHKGKGKSTSPAKQQRLISAGRIVIPSYAVDAACSGSPGPVEYRCVVTESGEELFREGPFANGTNNVGEFLAIVHALALLKRRGVTEPLYSDSRNALLWVKMKKCRTTLVRDDSNTELFDLIQRAETWLAENTFTTRLLKWDTEFWGENPADFGRK